MVPFGLFKKDKRKEPEDQKTRAGTSEPLPPTPSSLKLEDVQKIFSDIESEKTRALCSRLEPIRNSAMTSLRELEKIAGDMENETVKLEDLETRFKSVVENSRKTIIYSLKREASTDLPGLASQTDARKFKERFEAMMKRFGEVSGSHSKVLNVFLKKNASKIKDEFEVLSSLLKEVSTGFADYEREREPVVKCENLVNTALQKVNSLKSAHSSVDSTNARIEELNGDLERLKKELADIEGSQNFTQALEDTQKIKDLHVEQEAFRKEVVDLFAHVSRPLTKYSYGVTKETASRLYTLGEEPWRIFERDDISPYSSLLEEIKKAVDSDKVQLKDKDKIVQYLADIVIALPQLKLRSDDIRRRAILLSERQKGNPVDKAEKLRAAVIQYEEEIARNDQLVEQTKSQEQEKDAEVVSLLRQIESNLSEITGQKYRVVLDTGSL